MEKIVTEIDLFRPSKGQKKSWDMKDVKSHFWSSSKLLGPDLAKSVLDLQKA